MPGSTISLMKTLVMDGVRRSLPAGAYMTPVSTVVAPKLRPVVAPIPSLDRTGVSFDGIRRVMPTPLEVLQNSAAQPAGIMPPTPSWHLPSLRSVAVYGGLPIAVISALLLTSSPSKLVEGYKSLQSRIAPAASTVSTASTAIESSTLSIEPSVDNSALNQLLASVVGSNPDKYGVVVKDLKGGQVSIHNANKVFASASYYKLFVAQRVYHMVDKGELRMGDKINGRTVEDCLRVMISVSDNGCGRALGDLVDWEKQNATLKNLGFLNTKLGGNQETSAADVALLFERLYSGTLLSPSSTEHFLGILKEQKVNNRLPQGLPPGTTIAHKTGDLDGYFHDGGIVYGPKTDFLVVVTSGPWGAPGNALPSFQDLASKLYGHFSQ